MNFKKYAGLFQPGVYNKKQQINGGTCSECKIRRSKLHFHFLKFTTGFTRLTDKYRKKKKKLSDSDSHFK